MKSNKNHSISYNNSGVITSQIKLRNLTKARKSEKHSSFSVRYCKGLFFFLIFFPLLSVLPPASFSPLIYFVRNFFELPGHVCYHFILVNNILSQRSNLIVYVIAHFVFSHAVFFDNGIVRKNGQK